LIVERDNYFFATVERILDFLLMYKKEKTSKRKSGTFVPLFLLVSFIDMN